MDSDQPVVVIGAGPAGLVAAHELVRGGLPVVVLEAEERIGGLAATLEHNGNRIDIGGHRFFSRSQRVRDWWLEQLPLASHEEGDPQQPAMLVRPRSSAILFEGRLYRYPLRLSPALLRQLGGVRLLRILLGMVRSRLTPGPAGDDLESFFIRRFGRPLYQLFFRDYSEKVWGRPCSAISADWGGQRIDRLDLWPLIRSLLAELPGMQEEADPPATLIERFWYPRLGPGQLWQQVAGRVDAAGGVIHTGQRVVSIEIESEGDRQQIVAVTSVDRGGDVRRWRCSRLLSTMPLAALANALGPAIAPSCRSWMAELPYRDFITIGIEAVELLPPFDRSHLQWIYIQDPDYRCGRLQFYHNWSRALLRDPTHAWLGLELFCQQGDALWQMEERQLVALAVAELERLGVCRAGAVVDHVVFRVPQAYPAYHGSYQRLSEIDRQLARIVNLERMGRNGRHRYNNQDGAMLDAFAICDRLTGRSRSGAEG